MTMTNTKIEFTIKDKYKDRKLFDDTVEEANKVWF